MNKLQKRYVEALRSNSHRQCKKKWFNGNKCCAIGLLTQMVYPDVTRFTYKHIAESLDRVNMIGRINNYSGALSTYQVLKISSLKICKMNDSGKTFNEIADAIESNPSEFFEAVS